MPFIKLQFKPGLNRDQTNYSGEGGWWNGDKIRFRSGYPQKIGGWVKACPFPIYGVCRQMWNWITTYTDNLLALGTSSKVYIELPSGSLYDITPLRDIDPILTSPDTNNCIQTTSGSNIVKVNLAVSYSAITSSFVTISGVVGSGSPLNIGGIPITEINGNHQITEVDLDTFSFTTTTAATSTVAASGGTAISIAFEISPGSAAFTYGYGWGTGPWGGYYTGVSPPDTGWGVGSSQPILLTQRDWFFDNLDNDLLMNIRGGQPYYWVRGTSTDPTSALETRAITLQQVATDAGYDPTAVPGLVTQLLVSQQDKHILAFGAVPYLAAPSAFDPLLIRWSDQDNPGQWTPEPTNSAGDIRVSRGSRIIFALPTRQEILVFTDSHLYTLQFTGTTDVFSLQEYADNISVASPRCAATASSVTYWMGQDKFYAYSGRVETLACSVRNYVFQHINKNQFAQVVCGTSEEWNEVWWFYPSDDSNWNNKYVVYNHMERIWYYGDLERTAWLDTPLRQNPLGVSTPFEDGDPAAYGTLYLHESGVDADGLPLAAFIQSNDFDLEDGEEYVLTRRMIPDLDFDGSTNANTNATVTLTCKNFPGDYPEDTNSTSGTVHQYSVTQYTSQLFMRARARQMAFKIQSEQLGVQWQLGSPRIDGRKDGKR